MWSIRYFFSEFRAQRASFVYVRPKEASNSLASAASFGTQFTLYRIGWRANCCGWSEYQIEFFVWLVTVFCVHDNCSSYRFPIHHVPFFYFMFFNPEAVKIEMPLRSTWRKNLQSFSEFIRTYMEKNICDYSYQLGKCSSIMKSKNSHFSVIWALKGKGEKKK